MSTLDTAAEAATLSARAFPPDFVFGAATASYQIEGAVDEDGRGPSIWDTFAATPGHVRNGDTGTVACDHYHRHRDDVALMTELGLGAYRFSLAWPRIIPDGRGPVDPRGIAFYDRLVDDLLAAGITPWATLYHWDLPQPLEDAGGWPARETVDRFAEFAHVAAEALGDRVQHWVTLNEPWCSAFLGYASGRHAPGRHEPGAAVAAAHHLMLGHGRAVTAIRAAAPSAQVGVTLNLYPVSPSDDSPGSADAARRIDGLHNRWFLDPVFHGRYPADVVADLAAVTDMGFVEESDLHQIRTPLDFLGVNYYTRHVVRPGAYPGTGQVEFTHRGLAQAANGWEVDPAGLVDVLVDVHENYTDLPVYVTENGSAWWDEVTPTGEVDDPERTAFFVEHLRAAQQARQRGVPLQGYFAWSLLDNFEWAEGYAMRFGLVHVDFESQRRTVKTSGRWYASFMREHRLGILSP